MDKQIQDKFWQAFAESPFIMIRREEDGGHAEPMTAQLDRDAHHQIWFFAKRGNRIAPGGKAMGQVMAKDHEVFACLSGTLVPETDKAVWDRHWSDMVEAWLPNGRNDPEVIMLRFEIEDSEVWTADPTANGRLKLHNAKPPAAGQHATGAV